MKIIFHKLRYLLFSICIFELVFGGIAIYVLHRCADEKAKEFLSLRIIDGIELLRNLKTDKKTVLEIYESGALAKCRALALALDLNRGKNEQPLFVAEMAKTLDVETYSITNGKGIVEISNDSPTIGFDMHSTEQSRAFLPALSNPGFTLIQNQTPHGLDGKVLQYIGIARRDQPGIVQIGYSLQNYAPMESTLSLSRRMQAMRIGEQGFVLVVRNNQIIAVEDTSILYKNLSEIGIAKLGEAGDFFNVKFHGKKYIASYESMGDIILIAMIPEAEIFGFFRLSVFFIFCLQIGVLVLIWLILRFSPKSVQLE